MAWSDTLNYQEYGMSTSLGDSSPSVRVGLLVRPDADDFNAWADVIASYLAYRAALSDALGSYADSLSAQEQLRVDQGADALGSYADSVFLVSGLLFPAAGTSTMSMSDGMNWVEEGLEAGLNDFLAGRLTFQVLPAADDLNTWDDTLAGFYQMFASLPADDLNAWLDALDKVLTTPNLTVELVDSMAFWDDTPGGIMSHDGSLTDDWSNLSDSIVIRLTGGGGAAEYTYIIIGLNQTGFGPSIGSM